MAQSSTQREADEVRKSLELLQQWTDVVRDSVKIEGLLTTAKSEAASVAKELEDVRKKTAPDLQNGNGLSSWMGLYLQRKREQLPNVSELRRELMSQQEQLEKTEALLANVSSRLEELREPSLADPISPNALVMTQREALEKMKSDLDKNVWTFFSLSAERERMINDVIAFQTLVDEHVLWMRSAAPIQASDLPDAWRAFQLWSIRST